MIGYKGFDSELKCYDYQYEIGKTLTMCPRDSDKAAGLHFCLNPLNVLNYCGNVNGNRFAVVESIGDVLTHPNIKVATNRSKDISEISYDELIRSGVKYSIENGIENGINFEIGDNVLYIR
jgi:hypothetical protein